MRLFLLAPTTVFAARVNQATFSYPISQVTFDGVTTGAYGDIEPGMTVLFGSSAGDDDYGRQRVRKAATSSVLYFGRSSEGTRDGEVDLSDDAYITVLDDYRVWAKIPRIDNDGTIYKDQDIEVGTYTTDPPPKANAGQAVAGTIDSGTDLLRLTLPGTGAKASFATAPGASISTYAWTLPTGVALVGGYNLSDSEIEVDCDAGFYWIGLTVTDDNAEAHTVHLPVFARDPDDDDSIGSFTIDSHTITPQGQRIGVRLLQDIPESTYPDGTLVMLWEGEPADGGDRSHMIFTGWHQTDPSVIAAERTGIVRDTTLECVDVAGRLDTLPGFAISVEAADSPDSWTQMASPNMDLYLHYLLHWHSTALEVADWSWTGTTTDYPFVVLGNAGQSLWDQISRRAGALVPDYVLTCNTLGQLQTVVDPMLQDSGDRTSTVQATLAVGDWRLIRYVHQRPPRWHWHRGAALLASNTTLQSFFCIAPGLGPGQGETHQDHDEQLAISQTDLNACEGHRYARINAPEGRFVVVLTAGDDLDIEPADMTWVRLNISAATAARRGLTFTNERGLVQQVDIRYQFTRTGTVKTVELNWERETSGTPAVTYYLPTDGLPDPEWELPDMVYDWEPENTTAAPAARTQSAGVTLIWGHSGTGNGGVYYTLALESTPTAWVGSDDALPTASGDYIKSAIFEKESSGDELLYLLDGGRIFRTMLPLDDCTWEIAPANADACATAAGLDVSGTHDRTEFGNQLAVSVLHDKWQWVTWLAQTDRYSVTSDCYFGVAHTRDGWNTVEWSAIVYQFDYDPDANVQTIYPTGIAINQWDSGETIYAACYAGRDIRGSEPESDYDIRLYKSANGGTSWSLVDSFEPWIYSGVYPAVYMPFSDTDGATVYWTDTDIIRRSTNGGGAFSTIATPAIQSQAICRMVGPVSLDDIVDIVADAECWEYEDGVGLTHITPDMTGYARDLYVLERDINGRATKVLLAGSVSSNSEEIQINESGGETDVSGNWPTGNAVCIARPELGEYTP